jgi:SAM-dependent MidA family methyltransferase
MLPDIIKQRIDACGPLSFREYMDMALYYPELGYYTSGREKIGVRGDFCTSPSLHPLFGRLIARQLIEMWDLTGEETFTVIEFGAGPGLLCRDILAYIEAKHPQRYGRLEYCIIEKSDAMKQLARGNVPAQVKWLGHIRERTGFTGCVLSNELLDNFPVHRVIMKDELFEVRVDFRDGFREVLAPAGASLRSYFEELKLTLPAGTRAEINLAANEWISEIAAHLRKGFVLTIDYGYPAGELLFGHRKEGTLTCFYRHRVSKSPYEQVGEQDITAHVNFSGLCLAGHKAGLGFTGFTDQAHFLASLGFYQLVQESAPGAGDYQRYKLERQLANVLLGDMGYKFKVLIQQKGLPALALSGLPAGQAAARA